MKIQKTNLSGYSPNSNVVLCGGIGVSNLFPEAGNDIVCVGLPSIAIDVSKAAARIPFLNFARPGCDVIFCGGVCVTYLVLKPVIISFA